MIFLFSALVAASAGGAAAGYKLYPVRHPAVSSTAFRQSAILAHSAQMDGIKTIVIGDSIVEQADLSHLCDDGIVFNAGVSGARAQDLWPIADKVFVDERPRRIYISVGINDTAKVRLTTDEDFRSNYEALVARARTTADTVRLVLVSPTTRDGTHGASYFDQAAARRFNNIIREIGARNGLRVIDISDALKATDNMLPAEFSVDGPHLTAAAYVLWKSALSAECE